MNKMNRARVWLAGAAIGVMLALLVAPATSWLVRTQVRIAVPISPPLTGLNYLGIETPGQNGDFARTQQVESDFAARHPDDLQVQMAVALDRWTVDPRRGTDLSASPPSYLRPLRDRFPESGSLRANIIRLAAMGEVTGSRREEESVLDVHPTSNPAKLTPPRREAIDAYLADAEIGERLEPSNGFFPFMRSVALYADHRDEEALAAIERTASCPDYREHYEDEVYGRLRVLEEACGERSATSKVAVSAAVLFPHFAALRSAARVTIAKAVQAEQAGDLEAGFKIRHDLIRAGRLLHDRAHSIIGMLVGDAIMSLAIARPGGAEPLKLDPKMPAEERQQIHRQRYYTWLEKIGHPEEAAWCRDAFAENTRIRKAITPIPDSVDVTIVVRELSFLWMGNVLLLSNAAWLLGIGGIAALLMRKRALRAGLSMTPSARIATMLAMPYSVALFLTGFFEPFTFAVLLLGGGALIGLLGFLALWKDWKGLKGGIAVLLAATTISVAGIAVVAWQARTTGSLISLWSALLNSGEGAGSDPSVVPAALVVLAALMWAVPVCLGGAIALVSLICRVPLSVGLARGFRGLAAPAACILLLVYPLTLIPTVRKEATLTYMNDRWIRDEVHWVAEVKGISLASPNVLRNIIGR